MFTKSEGKVIKYSIASFLERQNKLLKKRLFTLAVLGFPEKKESSPK
jgi:hypothetical protein